MSVTGTCQVMHPVLWEACKRVICPNYIVEGLCAYLYSVSGPGLFDVGKDTTDDVAPWTSSLQKCGVSCTGS